MIATGTVLGYRTAAAFGPAIAIVRFKAVVVAARPHVVLNISNCVAGGGLQIALWFVARILQMRDELPYDVSFIVNQKHVEHLALSGADVLVLPASPMRSMAARNAAHRFISVRQSDLVFSLFGPSGLNHHREISGVANAFITSLSVALMRQIFPRSWPLNYLRYAWYGRMLARMKALIFETDGERRRFVARRGYPTEQTHVVPNSINDVFASRQYLPSSPLAEDGPRLLFVTGFQRHKNNHMIAAYADALRRAGVERFTLALTLDPAKADPIADRADLKGRVELLGHLDAAGLLQQYERAHLIVLPSSLETYSAVFNEVRFIPRTLLVSDRAFARDICSGFAVFFEPLDASDFASAVVKSLPERAQFEAAAWERRDQVMSPDDKFNALLAVMRTELLRQDAQK